MDQKVFDTKKLGFGLMRLPKNGDEIDIEQTKQMVDMFMEAGFTYFDTAWAYTGSEEAIRKALVERYPRDSFTLATKMAAWIKCETREDAIAQFDLSLERSGAGYFDYYLLHNLGEHRTKFFEDFDLWNWALEQKAAGKIKHLGFSFHSNAEELDEILRERNMPIIVMEPVKGGKLVDIHEDLIAMFKEADPEASVASWALRF
ncbi:MAG: aldo/keto reductase, partial [Firmicutes bacterium]|nr:aldo/keto reductase [Bacillota bacterium]